MAQTVGLSSGRITRAFIGSVFVVWSAGPFVATGTVRWVECWSYLGALAIGLLAHRAFVARMNPELLRVRQRIGAGTPAWDLVWNACFWPLMAAVPLTAGVERRLPPFSTGLLGLLDARSARA